MLSLYFNYLSTGTLNLVCKYTTHRAWPHPTDARWHAVQFGFSWSERHPFNREAESASGEPDSAGKPGHFGAGGSGKPPAGLAWTGSGAPVLGVLLAFRADARERGTHARREGAGGQAKVTLPPNYSLGRRIRSLWRSTKCLVCRFAGMVASMT